MQVTKPAQLGLSTRPITFRNRHGLSISAMLHVPFEQGERGRLWDEQSMWNFLAREMDVPLIDEGIAKLSPEFLVHGYAYPGPAGHPARALRARLGTREKTLLVFGDRHWDGDIPSEPRPFDRLPLSWTRAFGGPTIPLNPRGLGTQRSDGVHRLPNIESPSERIVSPTQKPSPAGFAARDAEHPERLCLRGTYDQSYLSEHAPGFAADMDWRYFNIAPPDQWMEGLLAGDEDFELEGMHPEKDRIEGRLPGFRARVLARKRTADADDAAFTEVPLNLTTVWFFPHAERAVLIFQGLTPVAEDDGADVVELVAAVERIGTTKDDAHYLDVLARRADPDLGAVHALNDADLLPEGVDCDDPASVELAAALADGGLRADVERRRAAIEFELAREEARRMGRDPEAMGLRMPAPKPAPTGSALAAHVERQLLESRTQQVAALEDMLTVLEKALELERTHGIPLLAGSHRGPPRYDAAQHREELRRLFATAGTPFDEAALFPKLLAKEDREREGYLMSAHLQPPAPPMGAEAAQQLRLEMVRAHALGLRNFILQDFTGADFANLDLSGVDFTGAHLEHVDFSHSNLSGAIFDNAVLAHAILEGAIAIGASFRGANLGKAKLDGIVLDQADLRRAILAHCRFERAHLHAANLADADWTEATWHAVDARYMDAAGQIFHQVDLRSLRLEGADLRGCNFIECDLAEARLEGARLEGSSFLDCNLEGAKLASAQASNVSFTSKTRMRGIDLRHAVLRSANLGGMDMEKAILVKADLRGANLSGTLLGYCDARAADAQGALMARATLRGGNWQSANLRDCILQKADLRELDLRDSNLFGADLSNILIDGSTHLQGAMLARAKTWPRRERQQQAGGGR